MENFDARRIHPKAQETLRLRAVKAVVEDGKTHQEVANLFGVARGTVTKWVSIYKKGGYETLKAKKQGRPKGGKLKGWQASQIARIVVDKHPEQLNFPWALWTRELVGGLIYEKFGIRLSKWTVSRYLRRWGFTPQRPLKRAYQRNPRAVEKWLHQEYPKIRYKAKKEHGEIHWCDEMGVRSDHQTGTTWGQKGNTPVVECTGRRFRCNMISSITNRGTLRFMVFDSSFTVEVFMEFLKRLLRSMDRKVFLIVDNHPVHKSKKVAQWLKSHRDRIEMYFLPPYSPELNPDEYLNNDVKSNAVGRLRARTKEEMVTNLRSYLRSTQRQPKVVCNYFKARPVRYAA